MNMVGNKFKEKRLKINGMHEEISLLIKKNDHANANKQIKKAKAALDKLAECSLSEIQAYSVSNMKMDETHLVNAIGKISK